MAKLEAGKENETFSKIKGTKEIEEAIVTYGIFDLLIKTSFEKIEDLDSFVFDVLRRIDGITDTVTMISVRRVI
jgi:DNA-binding Lrp family transcriptional regulator